MSKHAPLIGCNYDKISQTIYCIAREYVGELKIDEEDKDIWRLYLEKGMFEEAIAICKKYNNPAKDFIGAQHADYLFSLGKYEEAAKHYATTAKNFEEIALKFNEGPQEYLISINRRIDPSYHLCSLLGAFPEETERANSQNAKSFDFILADGTVYTSSQPLRER